MTAPAEDDEHNCPGGCGTTVPDRRLACPADWYRLPQAMRDEINTAWRGRKTNPLQHMQAIAAASRWYRDNPRATA